MTLAFPSDEACPLVRSLLAELGVAPGSLVLDIDARDEMLGFLTAEHEGDRERALHAYFRTGWSVADSILQILRWRFAEPGRVGKLLDFASGYGRVTRFLVRELTPERVWVADVYAEAVEFQRERFGVHGMASAVRPEDFECAETFDAILVTSLFTHLPEERFVAWLRRLSGLLAPGGMLIFSVHDGSLLAWEPVRRELPASGILFEERSESGSLTSQDYGSTWVNEEFVRAAVSRAAPGAAVHRIERGLCGFQDFYVAGREVDFSGFPFHGEPQLYVERCELVGTDRLELSGWAVSYQGGVREVQVALDGEVLASSPVEGPRPEVAAFFGREGDPRFVRSGWACSGRLPAGASRTAAVLTVRVVDARGVAHPLQASSIDTARFLAVRLEARRLEVEVRHRKDEVTGAWKHFRYEMGVLRDRIAAMEASRFWKIRNAWFRVKRALGLTEDP
jgi:SAM-dependent methyltransferase